MKTAASPSAGWRGEAPAWIALALLAAALAWTVRPIGEFPLNDDWSYARAVQTWIESGRLHFTGWTSLPLIAQILWGRLFCLPAGFSFLALRLSTAVAGLLGTWGLFVLVRSAGHRRSTAFAAAATLAVNPLYVNLSHTFMTDVPFIAASIWALAGFVRFTSDPRRRWLWLGALASLAAALIRHPGAWIPIAFFLAVRTGPRDAVCSASRRPALLVPLALIGFCLLAHACWGLRPFWASQGGRLAAGLLQPLRLLERIGETAIYLGLFSLPFLLFALAGEPRRRAAARLAGTVLIALGATLALHRLDIRLPLAGNVLHAAGLGPVRLFDVATLGLPNEAALPAGWWTLATGLGLAGVGLGAALGRTAWRFRDPSVAASRTRRLLAFCVAGWIAPMWIAGYMDRYLLVILPPLLAALASAACPHGHRSRALLAAALAAAALAAAFGALATRDYLAWNRARWAALHELVEVQLISPDRIDGGFEFNGWHRYDPAHPADRDPPAGRSWWWVDDDEFVIALGPVPGYADKFRHPFPRRLGPSPGAIRVLRREAAVP
jgi:hypothetical protein